MVNRSGILNPWRAIPGYFLSTQTYQDLLTNPFCSFSKAAILGGGDGGVQDLLRALTKRRSAREIVDSLRIDPSTRFRLLTNPERRFRQGFFFDSKHGEIRPHYFDPQIMGGKSLYMRNASIGQTANGVTVVEEGSARRLSRFRTRRHPASA